MVRAKIVSFLTAVVFVLLALGLFNLEVLQGKKYRQLSSKNCIRLLPQSGARGKILDRNKNVIVDNRLSFDLMLMPQESAKIDKTISGLSQILGKNPKNLREAFKKGYISASMPVVISKNLDLKKVIALEELKQDNPGIIIQPKPLRHYPYSGLAACVTGYIDEIDRWRLTKLEDYGYKTKDMVGFGGVEEKYDYYLRQEEGGLSFEVDHRGTFMRVLGFKPPLNGRDIELTIDLRLQKIVEESLSGKKGSVVIMNPHNGEILAMASFPGFDPSVFINKNNSVLSRLISDKDAPFLNRAISGVYPAGSIFKVVVATAGLETKKINSGTSFDCQGKLLIGQKPFACWHTHGIQNLTAAIAHSCNVFFYKTGIMLGAQSIHDYALKFGLSRPMSFDLPYESSGFVPSPLWRRLNKFQKWYDGDTANLSIGQGDTLVTPLQMARMMAVFANKGRLVAPHILKAVDGKIIYSEQRKIVNLRFKDSTINYIRQGLRNVVSDPEGTGNVLSSLPVAVAGKTGTAQAPPGQAHAWFVGFLPYKEPKFVICVFLERGGPGYYSCLLAKEIIEKMALENLL